VQQAYSKIVNMKIIPKDMVSKMKERFGFSSSNSTSAANDAELDLSAFLNTTSDETRRLAVVTPDQVKKNRIILGATLLGIVAIIALLIVFRE
jgi:hypothetical protein